MQRQTDQAEVRRPLQVGVVNGDAVRPGNILADLAARLVCAVADEHHLRVVAPRLENGAPDIGARAERTILIGKLAHLDRVDLDFRRRGFGNRRRFGRLLGRLRFRRGLRLFRAWRGLCGLLSFRRFGNVRLGLFGLLRRLSFSLLCRFMTVRDRFSR